MAAGIASTTMTTMIRSSAPTGIVAAKPEAHWKILSPVLSSWLRARGARAGSVDGPPTRRRTRIIEASGDLDRVDAGLDGGDDAARQGDEVDRAEGGRGSAPVGVDGPGQEGSD